MASPHDDSKEIIERSSSSTEKELMDNTRNVALEERAVEMLLASARVTEKQPA